MTNSNSLIEEKVKEFEEKFCKQTIQQSKGWYELELYDKDDFPNMKDFLRQSLSQISQEEYKRGARERDEEWGKLIKQSMEQDLNFMQRYKNFIENIKPRL